MRIVIQRVSSATVTIAGQVKSKIDIGFLIYLGIELEDDEEDVIWLTQKITGLRIFADDKGAMNLSLQDVHGDVMLISQFTLHAKTKKGNRPSFTGSAKPDVAVPLYEQFILLLSGNLGRKVQTGEFGVGMQVNSVNDGPVTILMDSKNRQ